MGVDGSYVNKPSTRASMAPLPDFQLSSRETTTAEMTRKLMDYLLSGALEPGQRLASERQLAATLGVGRAAVREALKTLSLLGLVTVRQGDGTYLSRDHTDLLPRVIEWGLLVGEQHTSDLVEAGRHVDTAIAELAASRHDDEAIEHLSAALEGMRLAIGDREAFIEADKAFHETLAAASGNLVLANLIRTIRSLLEVWIRREAEDDSRLAASFERHVAIVEAVRSGDVEQARQAMRTHMRARESDPRVRTNP